MVSSKFLSSVILAIAYASMSSALVQHDVPAHSTRRVRHISRDLKLETYHPESTYEVCNKSFHKVFLLTAYLSTQTFGHGIVPDLKIDARAPKSLNTTALAFVQSRLGVDADSVGYRSGYSVGATGEKYAYIKQYHKGIPFVNAVANVAWKNDKVVSFGSSFVKPS